MKNQQATPPRQTAFGQLRSLPRWQKIAGGALIAILLYTLAGFLAVPALGRLIAEAQVQRHLQRNVHIEKIRFNPYTLTGRIQNFTLFEPDGKAVFVAFRELYVNLQSISLFKLAPVIKEIRLEAPTVNLALARDGRWSFADLQPLPTEGENTPDDGSEHKPFRFSLNNIQIRDGRINFQDGVRDRAHVVESLDIDLPFLSNLQTAVDIFVRPQFAATINGTPLALKGSTKPFADSRETELDIDLRAIALAEYMPYLPPDTAFAIKSGLLDVKLHLTYINYADGSTGLRSAGTLNLNDLNLTDPTGRPLLTFDRLHLDIGSLEPMTGIVRFNAIDLIGPTFTISRLPDEKVVRASESLKLAERFRQINLEPPLVRLNRLKIEDARIAMLDFKSGRNQGNERAPAEHVMLALPQLTIDRTRVSIPDQKIEVAAITSADGRLELRRLADGVLNLDILMPPASPETPAAPPTPEGPPWQIGVEKIDIRGYAIQGLNLVPDHEAPLSIDAIQLTANGLTNAPEVTNNVDLTCRINATGQLDTSTAWRLAPLTVDTRIGLQALELAALYPFIAPYVDPILTDGRLSIKGDVHLAAGEDEAQGLSARFEGSAGLQRLRTIDHRNAEPLVEWENLQLDEIEVGYQPTFLNIGTVTLQQPASHVRIDPEGRINLMAGAEANTDNPPAAEGPAAEIDTAGEAEEAATPLAIGQVLIKNGNFHFSDQSFKPGFVTTLDHVEGRLRNFSTTADQPAEIQLAGKMGNLAPLEIAGQIKPRPDDLRVDLTISLRGMDLTATSPYSGRFVSRNIRKGKLSADINYKVDKRKVNAEHGILIDQFDFGTTVASEEALDLPIDLAVALLRDRQGQIHIDLPVEGDMDDPDFSIGGIVLRAFVNLIVKAVAAPFTLIGAMFGGEDLSLLEFEAGSPSLTPASVEKLDGLANVLYERPGLQLEISGFADTARDAPALAESVFQYKLKTQKILALTKNKTPAENPASVTITPEEYPVYLQAAYAAETFPKPRSPLGFEKTLPPEEAERLMRENIEIDADQLASLARERARVVQDQLLASGRIEAERIFMVKPDNVLAPEAMTGVSPSRVELGLK